MHYTSKTTVNIYIITLYLLQCYESYEVQFPAGILPPSPHSIKLVYDLEGAGIEAKSQLKNEITPTRPDEDRLRVIASPRKETHKYASVECTSRTRDCMS